MGSNLEDHVNLEALEQVLEMDEIPEEHDFSGPLIEGFKEQVEATLTQMEQAFEDEDLQKLASLAGNLESPSKNFGCFRIENSCNKIKLYAMGQDEAGDEIEDSNLRFQMIVEEVNLLQDNFKILVEVLDEFFKNGETE